MNRLPLEKQAQIAALLVEGNSLRATSRLTGVAFNTVMQNALWLGEACYVFHGEHVRNLHCKRLEADEAWTFVYAKDRMKPYLPDHTSAVAGSKWTWIAIDPDSRLVVTWLVSGHNPSDAQEFMDDLADRVPGRVQLTTDELKHYRTAVENAFGDRVDYATSRKVLGDDRFTSDGRYEKPALKDNIKTPVFGSPDMDHVTTTTIESRNLQLRMSNRRYARDTNAFSRSLRNLRASVALHFTYHNFCRIHPSIRVAPAMQAGLTDHVIEIDELIEQLNVEETRKAPY